MAGKKAKPNAPAKPRKSAGSDSLLGWLGRQVGHVKKAVTSDVTRPAPKPKQVAQPAKPKKQAASPSTVIFRQDKVEEADMPDKPGVKLRRTIIDEVIVVQRKQE